MTWDNVPYVTQLQGAPHSPEVFRTALYASTGGSEGIIGPADCKVSALTVPGTSVRIAVGAALVLSRAAGGAQQTYAARNPTVDTVAITNTGASARSDLVVVRIEDPGMAGEPWDDPDDPATGQYVFTRVIPNVPAGTTRLQDVAGHENDSGIALARIDIPAGTGTITNAMIKDLRALARPRETKVTLADYGTVSGTLSQTNGTVFPPYTPTVTVPDWATHVQIDLTIASLSANGSSNGFANVQGRDASGNTVVDGDTIAYNVDVASASNRFVFIAGTYGDVRSLRGKTFRPTSVMRKAADNRGNLTYDQYSQIKYVVTFYERIV